jgi:hypothetical protein
VAAAAQSPHLAGYVFPRLGYWLSRTIQREVWQGLGKSFDDLGARASHGASPGPLCPHSTSALLPPATFSCSNSAAAVAAAFML